MAEGPVLKGSYVIFYSIAPFWGVQGIKLHTSEDTRGDKKVSCDSFPEERGRVEKSPPRLLASPIGEDPKVHFVKTEAEMQGLAGMAHVNAHKVMGEGHC